ncbi:ABC transporter substrate-binding protein [Agromyces sp. C10]|uniref:ABC transporter substrate-binding protein n=1 Tax=Agromyces sp. C10 TaxID=2935077 RepID=UPI00200AA5F6|nr:ABC transporter substrate-binding protein [Agromyces sp. C10]MCK8610093.1 ABC transporter substrate-binding protein [Agromyces sp. C10]
MVVPAELAGFARGFLLTGKDTVRFLWRGDGRWHGVRLDLVGRAGERSALTRLVSSQTELPQGITAREIDVLTLVALGLTNGEIAERLGTQVRTVSTQIERLLGKLNQRGRAGLAAIAVDAGLIVLPIPGGTANVTSIAQVSTQQNAESIDTSGVHARALGVAFPTAVPYVLGTVVPLSGLAGEDGIELLHGAALAVQEINARGGIDGRPIEHVVKDADIFDEGAVRQAFTELFARGVDAITTSYVSAEHPFVLDMVADYGRPFLHTATLESQVDLVRAAPIRFANVFQTCPSEKYYGLAFLRFINALATSAAEWQPQNRRVVAIEIDVTSSRIADDRFRDTLAADGWDVTAVIRTPPHTTKWGDILDRIEQQDPDVLLVAHFLADDIAELQRQIHRRRLRALVHYVYAASIPRFQTMAGEAADGIVWSTVTGRYDDAMGEHFKRTFTVRYGEEPGWSQASAAYDQVKLIADAWNSVGSADAAAVIDHLRSTAYRGINGVYFLGNPGQTALCYPDETRDSSLGLALMTYQIQAGRAVVLGPEPKGDVTSFRPRGRP